MELRRESPLVPTMLRKVPGTSFGSSFRSDMYRLCKKTNTTNTTNNKTILKTNSSETTNTNTMSIIQNNTEILDHKHKTVTPPSLYSLA